MDDQVKKIMDILEDELDMEKKCYLETLDMMKRTHNPITKIRLIKSKRMFVLHGAALSWAIYRIKKELNLKD